MKRKAYICVAAVVMILCMLIPANALAANYTADSIDYTTNSFDYTVDEITETSITVSWNTVPGASCYIVRRKSSGGGYIDYAYYYNKTSHTFNNLNPGELYTINIGYGTGTPTNLRKYFGVERTIRTKGGEKPTVSYQTHVQNVGWQDWVSDGEVSGTSGQSLRLEGMHIKVEGKDNAIEYRTHVQNIGWQGWVSDGEMTGTSGRSLRLEAIDIRLTGDMADQYDVYYRVHAQNFGWMDWAKNGQSAGTAGYSYRLEAIEIVLVDKGDPAPGPTAAPFRDKNPTPDPGGEDPDYMVRYKTHVQNVGWQGWKMDGETAGTSGQSLRLEGMYIEIEGAANAIEYRTHVQNIGWQDWVSDGQMTGTSGQSLRLEGIQIRLTGEVAENWNVYYRVHAQNAGWLGWTMNGHPAGSEGHSYRLEAIEIVLAHKNDKHPVDLDSGPPYLCPYDWSYLL